MDGWLDGSFGYVNAEKVWFGSGPHEVPEIWFLFYSYKYNYSVKLFSHLNTHIPWILPCTKHYAGFQWHTELDNGGHPLWEVYILGRKTRLIENLRHAGGKCCVQKISGASPPTWRRDDRVAWVASCYRYNLVGTLKEDNTLGQRNRKGINSRRMKGVKVWGDQRGCVWGLCLEKPSL